MIHTVQLPNGKLLNGIIDDKGKFLPLGKMQRTKNNLEFVVKRIKEINELRTFLQDLNRTLEGYHFDIKRTM